MFPGKLKYFMESYRKATSEKYNPLIVDLSPHSNPLYKIRMHILPDQFIDSFPTRKLNMNRLVKTQSNFLRLIISTPSVQQRALIKTILPSQKKAIVQIVYNTLIGNRIISAENKKKLKKHRVVIRRNYHLNREKKFYLNTSNISCLC